MKSLNKLGDQGELKFQFKELKWIMYCVDLTEETKEQGVLMKD